ncbi:MAG: LamG-like jellyroll fold domain-containing protein, partial [Sulfuricaulis sp.]|nr:LamG-like jellyroll fold domain-containing protein [Sulfuricaulis sp.]
AFGKKVYADVPPYLVASYFPGKVGQYAPDIGAIPATDLTAQLKSMAASGIDGAAIDIIGWSPGDNLIMLKKYLRAARGISNFTLAPIVTGVSGQTTTAFIQIVEAWAAASAGSTHQMSVNGRPVVFVFGASQVSAAGWSNIRTTFNKDGVNPFVVGDVGGPLISYVRDGSVAAQSSLQGLAGVLDALYTFSPYSNSLPQLFALEDGIAAPITGTTPRLHIASVTPGYWSAWLGLFSRQYQGTKTYRQFWDESIAANADWTMITTWSDYVENTHIEPSRNNSNVYAAITRSEADKFRGAPPSQLGPQFWVSAPAEIPDGPGAAPLEGVPSRERIFELVGVGSADGTNAEIDIVLPDGTSLSRTPLTLAGDDRIAAASFSWEPDRTLNVPYLRAIATVGSLQASLPLLVWPRNLAHKYYLRHLSAALTSRPPPLPLDTVLRKASSIHRPWRMDYLNDLDYIPQPTSTTFMKSWGFWDAALVNSSGLTFWTYPVWIDLDASADQETVALLQFERPLINRSFTPDSSTYGNHGSIHNVNPASTIAPLVDGGHVFASSPTSWAELPGSIAPANAPFTVEMWIRPTQPGGMLWGDVSGSMVLQMKGQYPQVLRGLAGNRWYSAPSSSPIPLNQWSHVAGVFTGSVLQLYANGVLVGQVTLPAGKSRSSRIGVGRNA